MPIVLLQVYTVMVIVLEVWMDIETFTIMPILPVFTQIGGWLIVLSHWLWILCGIATAVKIALAPKKSALRNSLTGKRHNDLLFLVITHRLFYPLLPCHCDTGPVCRAHTSACVLS